MSKGPAVRSRVSGSRCRTLLRQPFCEPESVTAVGQQCGGENEHQAESRFPRTIFGSQVSAFDDPTSAIRPPLRQAYQTDGALFAVTTGDSGVVCRSALTLLRHLPILSRQRRGLRRTVSWCFCAVGTEICSTGQPRIWTSWARCARRQRPISRNYVENIRSATQWHQQPHRNSPSFSTIYLPPHLRDGIPSCAPRRGRWCL